MLADDINEWSISFGVDEWHRGTYDGKAVRFLIVLA
jgi:hypothetical protein